MVQLKWMELNFKYADGTRYYPVGTTAYDWMHVAGNQPEQTVKRCV